MTKLATINQKINRRIITVQLAVIIAFDLYLNTNFV